MPNCVKIARLHLLSLASAGLVFVCPEMAWSQVQTARSVVQPLPNPGVSSLNAALLRLAQNSEDVGALIDAGNASLKLGDHDAAIGFFSRADSISGGDGRAKAGLASAFVRSQNHYDALLMFDEAERAGVSRSLLAADRGLAYDLVGDNAHAQELYRAALANGPNDEVSRRLALSLAVTGDRAGAETVLRPLLDRRDLGAFRTRAFAMAILGDVKEAQSIANVRLPSDMAARLGPYLRYMPRLTAAQQIAAANFGRFPKTADIGRDDPRVAARTPTRTADAGLIPKGEPLGRKPKQSDESAERMRKEQPKPDFASARPLPEPSPAPRLTKPLAPFPAPTAAPQAPPLARAPTSPATVYGPAATKAAQPAYAPGKPAQVEPLARPVATAPQPATPAPPPPASRPRVADVFADLALPQGPAAPAAGAVDVTKIQVKRDAKPEPKVETALAKTKAKAPPPPPKPKYPSRIWVQVGTGRDKDALAFDWRRYNKTQGKLFKGKDAYVAKWGKTNRLLAGPFASDKAAQAFLADLKKADINSFAFTSKEGEQVDPLD